VVNGPNTNDPAKTVQYCIVIDGVKYGKLC